MKSMSSSTYLNRSEFNENISEIYIKSKQLQDFSWNLIKCQKTIDQQTSQHKFSYIKVEPTVACFQKEDVIYMEKLNQRLVELNPGFKEIVSFVYHIVYSDSYNVPVLYLNAFKSSGLQLNSEEFKQLFMAHEQISHQSAESRLHLVNLLSQQEHPLVFKPFYFLHPCKTAEWMQATKIECNIEASVTLGKINYTLKWMSFVFFALNIDFNLKFCIE